MNFDELKNNPFTSTNLEAGYRINDSKTDFDKVFPLNDFVFLQVKSIAGATKTFFEVFTVATEEENKRLQVYPSQEHIEKHRNTVDIVDQSITFCLGASTLFSHHEPISDSRIENNFEEILNKRLTAVGKPETHYVSKTSGGNIEFAGTTYVSAIIDVVKLANHLMKDEDGREVLYLFREGTVRTHVALERWYKIVESLENDAAFRSLLEKDRKFLKTYAQIFRHHKSNRHYVSAVKYLKDNFPDELTDISRGILTYKKYLRELIKRYFES